MRTFRTCGMQTPLLGEQRCQLFLEALYVAELPVYACKPNVRHLVEIAQGFHELLADRRRGHFALAACEEIALEIGRDGLHLALRNGPFLARAPQAGQDLIAAELLAPPVFFDDEQARGFH